MIKRSVLLQVEQKATSERTFKVLLRSMLVIIIGSFTDESYSPVIQVAGYLVVVGVFLGLLWKGAYFSFVCQLFICNHFTFGLTLGGSFNFSALIALVIFYSFFGTKTVTRPCALKNYIVYSLLTLLVLQVSGALLGNEFLFYKKLLAIGVFVLLLYLFYWSSLLKMSQDNLYSFVYILGYCVLFMLLVSINQKYEFFQSPFKWFPSLDSAVEYDMGILRSAGTFGNFESYAEYNLSVISILFPGILSGALVKKGKFLFPFSICIVFAALVAIILSGTRSSFFLFPLLFILCLAALGRRLKAKILASVVVFFTIALVVNASFELVDIDVFAERSQRIDFKSLDLSKIVSGEEINRGDIFSYALNKISMQGGLTGGGYFTTRAEYSYVQFDDHLYRFDNIPDYHNLYLAAIVIWGYPGLLCVLVFFLGTLYRGFATYYRTRNDTDSFVSSLLLGFTLALLFFMLNQFKIQFIREPNYFLLVLLLLVIHNKIIDFAISCKQKGELHLNSKTEFNTTERL